MAPDAADRREARRLRVPAEAAGERLDRHLAARLDEPRSQVQRWIRDGRVLLDGRPTKPAAVLAGGEELAVAPPPPPASGLEPEEGDLTVLHQDEALIVVDKPAGLTVHPGAGRPTGTLVHRLLARFPELEGVGGPGRPGIVHRLDKDTSGVLVVARTPAAYRALQRAFSERGVDKRYLALVYGAPEPPQGEIDTAIGRHPEERKRMTVRPSAAAGARPALTRYRTLAAAAGVALLEIDLATGRTHQIRVHLKSVHHPIVGDPVYGEARWKGLPAPAQAPLRAFPRPALHAWRLAFAHPDTGARAAFEAPPPRDVRELWEEVTGTAFPVTAGP
ncbi:MAG TPA: RluA family pseudouridine synthase [Thermoanaerobaculia bacterium]